MKSISERVDKLIQENKPLQVHIGNNWVDFDGEAYELLKFHRSDIREKPEKDFIIGDWWIPYNNATPVKLTQENIMYYIGTKPYMQRTEAKLWRPNVNEWCWKKYYGLVKVLEINHYSDVGTMYTIESLRANEAYHLKPCSLNSLEPFIGEQPTFLKEEN